MWTECVNNWMDNFNSKDVMAKLYYIRIQKSKKQHKLNGCIEASSKLRIGIDQSQWSKK